MMPDPVTAAFRAVVVDHVCFVRYYTVISPTLIADVLRIVGEARRKTKGPLYYCSLNDESLPAPTAERQKLMVPFAVQLLRSVDSMHIVFEGNGMRQQMMRMSMHAMITAARLAKRLFGYEVGDVAERVFLHPDVPHFLARVGDKLEMPRDAILRAAAEGGVL